METHLDRVDRSLEELTKKVQKHVAYKTSEIDTNNNENNNENKIISKHAYNCNWIYSMQKRFS